MKPIHITAGLLAIAAGAVALAALKGGRLHRRSGVVFVCAMLVMGGFGALLAILKDDRPNAAGGAIAMYFVVTAWLTVRRPPPAWQWIDTAAMLVALALALYELRLGLQMLAAPATRTGVPVGVPIAVATLVLLAVLGDMRMLARGIAGAQRLARHLWRMCFALFIATGSFFLGQAQVLPKPLRIMPLLALPVALVLIAMIYWLARVLLSRRFGRSTARPSTATLA
jgi:hypothetical protein